MDREEKLFQQMGVIRGRLETFPFSNHEVRCLKECLVGLIRTLEGEEIGAPRMGEVGEGRDDDTLILPDGGVRRGGREIAPGVVEFPAPEGFQPAGLDTRALPGMPPAMPPSIKPVPGSLAAQAMGLVDEAQNQSPSNQETSQSEDGEVVTEETQPGQQSRRKKKNRRGNQSQSQR